MGFGSLLGIVVFSGVDALRLLHEYRRSEGRIRQQFLFRNGLLNNIRSEVYLSGTYLRDYLLESDSDRAERSGLSLRGSHQKIERDLATYERQLGPGESADYEDLHTDLVVYWNVIKPILTWDTAKRKSLGYAFLRDEIYPRRVAMLKVADRIGGINEQQLDTANGKAAGLLDDLQTRIAVTLILGLLLGLGMAAFSMRKILQLESYQHARFLEAAQSREQLAHLSARLVEAQETERRSLSRELHDEVGQSLSAVLVELRNLISGLGRHTPRETSGQAEEIRSLVEGTIGVVRNMALLLRPSMLDDLGLIPALRWQAREASKRTGMNVVVNTELEPEQLPNDHKTCIYRIVQEALNNCARHAQAASVQIRVQQADGLLSLAITDDGHGFDAAHSRGMGLLGIEERAAQLGGSCQIHSSPGRGTSLNVTLPLPPDSPGAQERNDADSHFVSG